MHTSHTSHPAVFLAWFWIALQCSQLVFPIESPNCGVIWSDFHQLHKKFLLCPSSFTAFHSCLFNNCRTTKWENKAKDLWISQWELKGECGRCHNWAITWGKSRESCGRTVESSGNAAVLRCDSDWTFPVNWSPFIQPSPSRRGPSCFGGSLQGAVRFLPLCMMGANSAKWVYRGLMSFHAASDLQ